MRSRTSSRRRSPVATPSVSLTSLKVTRSTNTRATPSSLRRAAAIAASRRSWSIVRFGRPVTGSWSAWCAFSCASCWSVATSRPLARATLAWLASVSNSRRSSSTNELTSVRRLATTMAPTVSPSVVSGTIAASFTPISPSHPGSGSPGTNSRASLRGSSRLRSDVSWSDDTLARSTSSPRTSSRLACTPSRTGGSSSATCSPRRISRAPRATASSRSVISTGVTQRPGSRHRWSSTFGPLLEVCLVAQRSAQ